MITAKQAIKANYRLSQAAESCVIAHHMHAHASMEVVAKIHLEDAERHFRLAAEALGFDLVAKPVEHVLVDTEETI